MAGRAKSQITKKVISRAKKDKETSEAVAAYQAELAKPPGVERKTLRQLQEETGVSKDTIISKKHITG
jgi:DNA-binding XRE family transcriptional regulator